MTDQEKKFADEFVFRYFNREERSGRTLAIEVAKYAGYPIPDNNVVKADQIAQAIYNKSEIKTYIENQILEFKAKLHPSQRRTLWTAIVEMIIGDPDDWEQHGFINSTY